MNPGERMSEPRAGPGGNEALPPASYEHAARIEELFRRYNTRLVSSLVPLVGSVQEARDIAQQAYVELLQLERPGTVSYFAAYLYKTARNLATNRLVQRAQRKRLEPIALFDAAQSTPSPEPKWVAHEQVEILQRAIQDLPPKCRMAFVLRFYDALKYDQIAARMAAAGLRVDVRTVKRYVAHALVRCRQRIQAAEEIRRQP